MPIGERITADHRYIKCPPAASFFWLDNFSVDAGTAHIVHSNLSTLSEQNLRIVTQQIGPGAVRGYDPTKTEDAYILNAIIDAFSPSDPLDPHYDILRRAWIVGYDALCAGPLPACAVTLQSDPPGYRPRKIKGRLVAQKGTGGGSLVFLAAVTQGPSPPSLRLPLVSVTSSTYSTSGALIEWDFELTVPITRPTRELFCRASGADAEATNRIIDLYLWVSWYGTNPSTSASTQDLVYTFDAWEST